MNRIKLDDFLTFKFLSDMKFNDKGLGSLLVTNMDSDNNNYRSYLYWFENGKLNQLTGSGYEGPYQWIPDKDEIVFISRKDKENDKLRESGEEITSFYHIGVHGGEAVEKFKILRNVSDFRIVRDGLYLCYYNIDLNKVRFDELDEDVVDFEKKRYKEQEEFVVFEEIPFWGNGEGVNSKFRNHLGIYDEEKDKFKKIVKDDWDVTAFGTLGNLVIFAFNEYQDKMDIHSKIAYYDICSRETTVLDIGEYIIDDIKFISDKEAILLGTDGKKYGINQDRSIFRVDFESREVTEIYSHDGGVIGNPILSDSKYGGGKTMYVESGFIYLNCTENNESRIVKIDTEGNVIWQSNYLDSIDDFCIFKNNIYVIGFNDMNLQEIYKIDKDVEKVSEFNKHIHDKDVRPVESITFKNRSGGLVDGYIITPSSYEKGKKYPTILNIHGGPKMQYGKIFFHEMQFWANEGYVVIFCNPRGSHGKCDDFADIRGKYGSIDYEDIMDFVDYCIENYEYIDKDRMGVTGGSYGGFMTNWIIGKTDMFKAAVSQRGIASWITMFTASDIGYYFVDDQTGATVWDNHDEMWNMSPLKYANKVKTPTLFIHSEEDFRCPSIESIQMFTALKYFGVDTRMCLFKNENHGLSRGGRPKSRVRRMIEITEWFNKHI